MPSNFQFDDFSNMALYITRRLHQSVLVIIMPLPGGGEICLGT